MDSSAALIFLVIASVVVFVCLREFMCWYWKINEIKDLLVQIEQNTAGKSTVSQPENHELSGL